MTNLNRWRIRLYFVCALGALGAGRGAFSAPIWNLPQRLLQPDGVVLECYASGDEFHSWLHDANGYTIMQHPVTGFYVYAQKSMGQVIPTRYIAGRDDPAASGIPRGVNLSPVEMYALRSAMASVMPPAEVLAPKTGSMRNLVVFIRFAGEEEFADSLVVYARMFNDAKMNANSMRNYFLEASYGKLTATTYFYPGTSSATVISYQDTHPRGYFQPYNSATNTLGYQGGNDGSERRTREHQLLADAVTAIRTQVPDTLVTDVDGDGRVDNVCFIVSGSPTGWSSLLWPHRWSLYTLNVDIRGKRVYDYNLQLQSHLLPRNVGVLAHEMYHTLGAPDLYHYSSGGPTPVGAWDLMESNQNPPQHMGAHMKWRYGGWIASIPTLTIPGTYTLRALSTPAGNAFKVLSPYSTQEYFILEYRRKNASFESKIPGEGLVVYRINAALRGNADGPPDEVFVYRPGGSLSTTGTLSRAALSANNNRTSMSDSTSAAVFLTDGQPGGLHIINVGRMGDSIVFTLTDPISVMFDTLWATAPGGDSVRLSWVTRFEMNNRGFEVQRSWLDTTGWATVPGSFVATRGLGAMLHSYEFTDPFSGGRTFYRLAQVDTGGSVHYSRPVTVIPLASTPAGLTPVMFELAQNFPNPANPTTRIEFRVAHSGMARLDLFDVIGRHVNTLFEGRADPGRNYSVEFDGRDVASGVYFYALTSGGQRAVRRMVILR